MSPQTWMDPLGRALGVVALLGSIAFATACGAALRTERQPRAVERREDLERRLADEEARLARAEGALADESAACPERCRSSELLCEAARRVCAIVVELDDPSLRPRCERAEQSCADGERRVSSCGCRAGSSPDARP